MLEPEFANLISKYIYLVSSHKLSIEYIKENLFIVWESPKNQVRIFVTEDEDICRSLNNSSAIKQRTKSLLLQLFRYSGEFIYDTDSLPF